MATQSRKPKKAARTPEGQILTSLVLAIFKTNVDLVSVGPLVTHDPDIIAVRWQMLNALDGGNKTASQLGREMGLSRQGALWNVQALEGLGFVELVDNPEDLRAKLVALTPTGKRKLEEVNGHQSEWINSLAENFKKQELETALRVVLRLSEHARISALALSSE